MWIRIVISALMVLAALSACNTTGCLENRNSVPLAGFYASGSTPSSISLDSLQITGLGMPDPLQAAGQRISEIYLPMRATEQSATWLFAYKWKAYDHPALVDTIALFYDSDPYFASVECGVIYKYHINRLAYTTHLIDSVVITDSLITNTDVERIRIYFRVAGEEEEEEE